MTQLLEIGFSNALAATCLAIIVALISRFCRQPQVVFCLWLLVLIKLVTPPLFEVPLPLLASPQEAVVAESLPLPAAHARPDLLTETASPIRSASGESAAITSRPTASGVVPTLDVPPLDWHACLGVVRMLGTLTYVAFVAERVLCFQQPFRLTMRAPPELCEVARNLAKTMQLRRQPRIRITAGNVSPLVWNLTPAENPVVVLPQSLLSQLSPKQQTSLLAHELAHLRRGDHWVRWFELLVTALFWWHPVVWWRVANCIGRAISAATPGCCGLFHKPRGAMRKRC